VDAADAVPEFAIHRLAGELRETWQAKVLLGTSDHMHMCVLSVIAHNFDDAMMTLLTAVYGSPWIQGPFLCTAARILKSGQIVADVITPDGRILKWVRLFPGERAMERDFRMLADRLKLDDADRRGLFACVRRWVVCDYRIDPNMNPADPDAKRLVVH
jgi:hypothetical protein